MPYPVHGWRWKWKGTHLSLYIAVMKGDYDMQLAWPFQLKVTLILKDQD